MRLIAGSVVLLLVAVAVAVAVVLVVTEGSSEPPEGSALGPGTETPTPTTLSRVTPSATPRRSPPTIASTPTPEPGRSTLETTLIDLQTGRLLPLWGEDEHATSIAFSPDGHWLVFSRVDSTTYEPTGVYRVDLRASRPAIEALIDGWVYPQGFSVGGSFVFGTEDPDGTPRVNLWTSEGVIHQLANPGRFTSWSPDGRWLTYHASITGDDNPFQNFLVDTSTRIESPIGSTFPRQSDGIPSPSWAPDSSRFVFQRTAGDTRSGAMPVIELHTPGGGAPLRLDADLVYGWLDAARYLAWRPSATTPEARDIVAVDLVTGATEVLFRSINGIWSYAEGWSHVATGFPRLWVQGINGNVSLEMLGQFVDWSPDAKYLLTFSEHDDFAASTLNLYTVNGDLARQIPQVMQRRDDAFSPDSRSLAYAHHSSIDGSDPRGAFVVLTDVYVMDVASGAERLVAEDLRGDLLCIHWSPDGRFLVVGGACGL